MPWLLGRAPGTSRPLIRMPADAAGPPLAIHGSGPPSLLRENRAAHLWTELGGKPGSAVFLDREMAVYLGPLFPSEFYTGLLVWGEVERKELVI